MSYTKINSTAATLTKNRTEEAINSLSGMCVTCVDGCIGMCEIGKSAYRGSEVIYPQPFGIITSANEKKYPVDLSHFTILGGVVGAQGIEADSDKAIFPNVNLETRIGKDKKIKLRMPLVIPGLGSTAIAKKNWEGLAVGAALTGIPLTIGENVCGMDPAAEIVDGKVKSSKELEWRVKLYKKWQQDGYGAITVQANVEDTNLGVLEYAISELDVDAVELKWGQGAKNIGGEVKIDDLKKAQLLKKRGYIVLPDPTDPNIIEAFNKGMFTEFERHSRVGMVTEEGFVKRVKKLRELGAKHVFLKTGAYRPAALAMAVKLASKTGIDLLTVDAAGGGTGMSPWRMMNEWGVPEVELHSMLYKYVDTLAARGEYIPDIAVAGGFAFEDQILKGLALGAPYFKLVGMARAPLAAEMVGKNIGNAIMAGEMPVYIERFGKTIDDIFISAPTLRTKFNKRFDEIPAGGLGLYTYMQRLNQGLKQIMAGCRKFDLKYITRNDIAALTRDASEISGIPYIMECDQGEAKKILEA
ncbi:MAG: FMN-binding glutamate synthase family protein [Candidatus Omnitrophica bacterium]|nr:FMN-binding glutamate synthase family protein [Candidatus Omnitrophota bacterium]